MFKLALIFALLYQSPDLTRDSLLRELKSNQEPASKANLYYLLGNSYYASDPDLAISYCDSSLYFSDIAKLDNLKGNALNIKAVSYLIKSDFEEALRLNLESLKIREAIQDTVGLIESHLNLGNILYRKGESSQAAERYRKALVFAKMANNQKGLSLIYNNLGSFFRDKWKRRVRIWIRPCFTLQIP